MFPNGTLVSTACSKAEWRQCSFERRIAENSAAEFFCTSEIQENAQRDIYSGHSGVVSMSRCCMSIRAFSNALFLGHD